MKFRFYTVIGFLLIGSLAQAQEQLGSYPTAPVSSATSWAAPDYSVIPHKLMLAGRLADGFSTLFNQKVVNNMRVGDRQIQWREANGAIDQSAAALFAMKAGEALALEVLTRWMVRKGHPTAARRVGYGSAFAGFALGGSNSYQAWRAMRELRSR